jgi:hypothetical protein
MIEGGSVCTCACFVHGKWRREVEYRPHSDPSQKSPLDCAARHGRCSRKLPMFVFRQEDHWHVEPAFHPSSIVGCEQRSLDALAAVAFGFSRSEMCCSLARQTGGFGIGVPVIYEE